MSQLADRSRDDRPFAVIDIGSNSGRVVVFERGPVPPELARPGYLDR